MNVVFFFKVTWLCKKKKRKKKRGGVGRGLHITTALLLGLDCTDLYHIHIINLFTADMWHVKANLQKSLYFHLL